MRPSGFRLLTTSNHKTVKGEALGWRTATLELLPASTSGWNVCQASTASCRRACVAWAGRGLTPMVVTARQQRTEKFFQDRLGFCSDLTWDAINLSVQAELDGYRAALRLNAFSDLPWERIRARRDTAPVVDTLASVDVQLYDYTKRLERRSTPKYVLIYSHDGENTRDCQRLLAEGERVSVVFDTLRDDPLPAEWHGWPVVDGDEHDLVFTHPPATVVGLRAKGQARLVNPGRQRPPQGKQSDRGPVDPDLYGFVQKGAPA